MPQHLHFHDRLARSRLTSLAGWRDRALVWAAAALAGFAVVIFTHMTNLAADFFHWLWSGSPYWPLVITPLTGIVVVALTRRIAPGSAGSGIPQVMSGLTPELPPQHIARFVSLRVAAAKMLLGASALAGGFSTGREGPSVQIASCIMYSFRKFLGIGTNIRSSDLMLAGGAAGIAAAFNAPLAGVIFAIEELARRFEQRSSGLVVSAIVLSGVVSISMEGNFTYFGHLQINQVDLQLLWPAALCTVFAGLLGGAFSRLMIRSMSGTKGRVQLFRRNRPILFAGACGLAIALLGLVSDGAAHGSGYMYTREMLDGVRSMPVVYVLVKFLATWLSFWSGVPGGIFAPCLAVGAGLGNDVAMLLHTSATPLVAIGMVGFLAAATQAPITSFIIVMEMVDGHNMVLSLMAAALIASLFSRLISPALYGNLSQMQLEALGVKPDPANAHT